MRPASHIGRVTDVPSLRATTSIRYRPRDVGRLAEIQLVSERLLLAVPLHAERHQRDDAARQHGRLVVVALRAQRHRHQRNDRRDGGDGRATRALEVVTLTVVAVHLQRATRTRTCYKHPPTLKYCDNARELKNVILIVAPASTHLLQLTHNNTLLTVPRLL